MNSYETRQSSAHPLFNANRMKIGLFGINVSSGGTLSTAPTSFEPTYEHNLEIAQKAESLGLEFIIPFGRWRSFGGETEYNGNCMEVYTWASALCAQTEKICVFATSHVPTVHPLLAAKQATTIDHISHGRFGLNTVCGWFTPEMEMFGISQLDHDARYEMADEWISVVKRLWQEDGFNHDGVNYKINDGYMQPKPLQSPYPVLVNAGASEAGREFSAKHVDFNFITMNSLETGEALVKDIKSRAKKYNRDIGVLGYGFMLCRDTEKEAEDALNHILKHTDWGAAENIMNVLGIQSEGFNEQIREFALSFAAGWGGYRLVGTPEQVVERLVELEQVGVEGMALIWHDYLVELDYFGDRVLPLMKEAGLRI
ncbi:MAG: LLM class flavin-dependent oxidoreductase [Pseudomonadota bacterium]